VSISGDAKLSSRLNGFLSLGSTAAAALGLLGLLFSMVVNGVVFRIWGLNFYTVASPSDVLMSGANIVTWMALLVVLLAALFHSASLYMSRMAKRLDPQKRFKYVIVHDLFPFAFISFAFLSATASVYLSGEYGLPAVGSTEDRPPTWFFVSFLAAAIIGIASVHLIRIDPRSDQFRFLKKVVSTRVYTIVSLTLLFGLMILWYALLSKPGWIIEGGNITCSEELTAAWIGSETVVARCGNRVTPTYQSEELVVIPRSDLVFYRIPR